MSGSTIERPGHFPTVLASFLFFDMSFTLWVLLGALGVYIAENLALGPAEKGLMVAVPILSGALLRVPLGLLADRLRDKKVGVAIMVFLFLPLTFAWQLGHNFPILLVIGLMLGAAGASFAVALPLASRWYPPSRQGLIMGIVTLGNSGTVIANLVAPRLADWKDWHSVFGMAMLPLSFVLVVFFLMAKDSPRHNTGQPSGYSLGTLKQSDLWWAGLFYSITFGGFVGLSGFLPLFLRDQYGVSPIAAGYLTAAAAFLGPGGRPLGGYLADRFGGVRVLSVLLLGIGVIYTLCASLPPIQVMMALFITGMVLLGTGSGAVFQLVGKRFPIEIGTATGGVGAIGGMGGFMLPNLLGSMKQVSGSFGPGLLMLGLFACVGVASLRKLASVRQSGADSSFWSAPS